MSERLLSQIVRAVREKRGLTQTQLAAAMRVTQPAVARFESGVAPMSEATLEHVATALGITERALLIEGLELTGNGAKEG